MQKNYFKLNEEFKPAPQFKRLYFIYLFLLAPVVIFTWFIPVYVFAPFFVLMIVSIVVLLPILIILAFTMYWIPKYYDTIFYKLSNSEMMWSRGIWFKKTGIVPYNRITNIDISQGPVSRNLRIASLKIQTAGYSAPSGHAAEIRIEGIEQFEELRELIMEFVRGKKPVSVETFEEENMNQKILEEIIKIRELIEKS